jgi:hypothetical protein
VTPAERREASYHEAGHSVLSRVLCKSGGAAALLDGDADLVAATKSIGQQFEPLLRQADGYAVTTRRKDRFFHSILVTLAGGAAVAELLYQEPTGCEHDNAKVDAQLAEMGFSDVAAVRAMLMADARVLVRKHRQAIRRVARALKARGTLTGEEIDQIIREA